MSNKLVCGVGINDCPGWGSRNLFGTYEYQVYRTWVSMIRRCYSERSLEEHPTYRGCIVCDRWLTLSNFEEDIRLLPNYSLYVDGINKVLDKDIRVPGNKVYSPSTCMFVTKSESARDVVFNHPGNLHSKESRQKISESNRTNHIKPVRAINLLTGEERVFNSQKEASEVLNIDNGNISGVVSGRYKQMCGYKFERIEGESV